MLPSRGFGSWVRRIFACAVISPRTYNRARCLHLVASAGIYANLNGEYRRIPLGALKIGKIAQGRGALYTNDLLGDDRLPNKEWMKQNLLRSFAGFPLMFRGELLGVLAMFGRRPLSDDELDVWRCLLTRRQ
ncbi:MAG: GAF domain-containing protein [Nitrospira sp.]|nr:GAF domain-containing protein [Nitrospira sp.]